MTRWTADALRVLDAQDRLAPFRDRFVLPQGCVYLAAHLLGPMPTDAPSTVARALAEHWGAELARAGSESAARALRAQLADGIARLVGAAPHEIALGSSLAVDAFELLAAAVDLRPGRPLLLVEPGTAPALFFAAQGLCELLRGEVELRKRGEDEPLAEALDERVACLLVSHVDEHTGRLHDLHALAAAAHEVGALLFVDVSLSAGAMPVELAAANVDLALGSAGRYLCGGPGAPSFLFVAERHRESIRPPIRSWAGAVDPLASAARARAAFPFAEPQAPDASPLALEALRCGLALVAEADLELLREKAIRLGEAFQALVIEKLVGTGIVSTSPHDPHARSALVTFTHPRAEAIATALAEHGIKADVRRPDRLRFGFGPLWNTYEEVWIAAERLAEVVLERLVIDRSASESSSAP